jgi:16S rRNA processing protein RimM
MPDAAARPATKHDYLVVGTVRKPHGIRGELLVTIETDEPRRVFRAGRELVVGDAAGRPTDGRLTVERSRPFKDAMLVKPVGQEGRTELVESLRGATLLIPREEAAPLAEGEVFFHDLPGMRVVADGEVVGTIDHLLDLPAGLLLSIRREAGGELLVPFVREMIRRIDAAERVLELDAPPGLLEL